jgi:vacuolar-type H+-ATPase subunit E/Vma4
MAALAVLAVVVGLGAANSAAAAPSTRAAASKPRPQNLWRSYPLDPTARRPRPKPVNERPSTTTPTVSERADASPNEEQRDVVGTAAVAAIAAAMLFAAIVVALALRPRLAGAAFRPHDRRRDLPRLRLRFHRPKGAFTMANARSRFWSGGERDRDRGREQEQPTHEGETRRTGGSLDAWLAASRSDSTSAEPVDVTAHETAPATADVSGVAAEVGSVLKSAEEAAANIRRLAQEEATKLREEAKAAAEAEVAEARRIADAERADGQRMRAEAGSYAEETRAAADAHAKQVTAEAEREAEEIRRDAEARLARVDAEVEARVRQAEQQARDRLETLQTEADRYRERLESLLVVFRGMSSQLEERLADDGSTSGSAVEDPEETLEDALRRDAVSAREE